MTGATGWVAALIPLSLLSLVVVLAYARLGAGPKTFRRRSARMYIVGLGLLVIAYVVALELNASLDIISPLLLALTGFSALGLAWPWLSRLALSTLSPGDEA